MTTANVSEILKDKLQQIVEGVAFGFVEDDAAPLPAPSPGIEVRLNFTGTRDGAFWLAMSNTDSNRLAAGMLGRPLEETTGANEAAPAEFLNILGSWVLDALWGCEVDYHASVPSVEALPLECSVAWSLPSHQRAIVRTDTDYTIVCGVTWTDQA